MYRNDFWLLRWNRNCDIPIYFGTPLCQVKVDRQIAAESRQKLHLKTKKSRYLDNGFTKYDEMRHDDIH